VTDTLLRQLTLSVNSPVLRNALCAGVNKHATIGTPCLKISVIVYALNTDCADKPMLDGYVKK